MLWNIKTKLKKMIEHFPTKLFKIIEYGLDKVGEKIHLARKKTYCAIILGIMQSRSVTFWELALVINDKVETESNLRRIQRFFEQYELNYLQIAIILMSFIPQRKLTLCIDRTNWKFGTVNINILALTAYYKGTAIPIIFELLDKRGNSKQVERMDLLDTFIELFGAKRIKSILGDREFIGDKWYKYLLKNKIHFYIRIPKSHLVKTDTTEFKAGNILTGLTRKCLKNVTVNDVQVNIGSKRIDNSKDAEDPYLIVVTDQAPENATGIYQNRWAIETFFQAIKGRGLDIEATHLEDLVRLRKLVALVSITFTWCLTIGVWKHQKIKTLRKKNHGYRANSFFRYGLDHTREILNRLSKKIESFEHIVDILLAQLEQSDFIFNYAEKYKRIYSKTPKIIR